MRPRRLEETRQISCILPVNLIKKVQDEAKAVKKFPATVIERRLYHSYAVSPSLPTDPKAA